MTVKLGSISHGTLRSQDLIETFSDVLKAHRGHGKLLREGRKLVRIDDESAMSMFLDERLFPAMEALAPPFTYFGAHEGDGSDFGYWTDIDGLEEAVRDEDGVIKVEAGDEWPRDMPKDIAFVMEVNDHGNVALFHRSNGRLIWDCV